MPFIPHTDDDVREMLSTIGIDGLDRLFEEIEPGLLAAPLNLPEPLSEMAVTRLMRQRAAQDRGTVCLIGAGSYAHHIPAVVWQVASRGEFYTAYTPYQAEASQGTLQVLYEFQTMMASLTGMDVSNASLYDGASALAEAVLMAIRIRGDKSRRILMPNTVNPRYFETVRSLVHHQGIELCRIPFCNQEGNVDPEALAPWENEGYAALVIPQPNFFGVLEEVDALTDRAHGVGSLVIGVVNPIALGLLVPPGEWGAKGADIACGEGQPLGVPPSSGGPGFGFLCCRTAHMRQIPGRIVGRTVDHRAGKPGYVLTLQAREQHIRRSKATSNICTNQGLMTVAAAVHLSLLGPEGLRRTAVDCHAGTGEFLQMLLQLPGVTRVFFRPFFHEVVVRLPKRVAEVLAHMEHLGIVLGYGLQNDFPDLEDTLLICVTEVVSRDDMENTIAALREALA